MGLAYSNNSVIGAKTLLDNMFSQFLITNKVFSIWYGKSYDKQEIGQLFLGGSNRYFFSGSFFYIPVSVQGYWQFSVNKYLYI